MNFDEIIKQFYTKQKELIEEENRLFKEVIEYIFKNEINVKLITFVGSTPRFNDGEPCEHSEDFFYNDSEDYDSDFVEKEFGDLPDISYKVMQKYNEFFSSCLYHERLYTTNYKVIYYFKDGKVISKYEDYDCGY